MDDERSYVMLGGEYVWPEALGTDFTPIDDADLVEAIGHVVADHPRYLPADRWRIALLTDHDVVVASDGSPGSDSWAVLTFDRDTGSWNHDGAISFSQQPRPTPRDNARGLALTFTQDVYDVFKGHDEVAVWVKLTNISSEHIDGSTDSPVIGVVVGAPDAARLETLNIAGMARDYSLRPGKGIEIPVALATQVDRLPPGEYALEVTMRDPALKAAGAVLRIGATPRPK